MEALQMAQLREAVGERRRAIVATLNHLAHFTDLYYRALGAILDVLHETYPDLVGTPQTEALPDGRRQFRCRWGNHCIWLVPGNDVAFLLPRGRQGRELNRRGPSAILVTFIHPLDSAEQAESVHALYVFADGSCYSTGFGMEGYDRQGEGVDSIEELALSFCRYLCAWYHNFWKPLPAVSPDDLLQMKRSDCRER